MTLARRNQNWLPTIFNDFFDNDWMERTNATAPAINVKESKDNYCIDVAAPGMTKDDFNIRIEDDDALVITMEKKNETKDDNAEVRFLRREFSYSKFQQTMILPDDVDKEKIDAKMHHGVLNINLPKLSHEKLHQAQKVIAIS